MDLRNLLEPFADHDLEWRVQRAGKTGSGKVWAIVVPYVTNRAIMQRFDDVCGPENWKNEFEKGPAGGVLCGISVRIGDEWVTKWDGAENTGEEGADMGMAVKGGLSGAMKRAAVQWGVGRFLYAIPEAFANVHDNGAHRGKLPQKHGGDSFRWDPPAIAEVARAAAASSPTTRQNTASNGNGNGSAAPRQKGSPSAPKCDKCGGAMWDNRAKKASGEFKDSSPDFSCKDKQCKHAVWLKDEPTAADEAAEKDRVVAGIESMLREMSGMDAKRTDGARAHVDLIVTKPDVSIAELRTLAGMVKKALNEVKKEAATAYTGPNDYDDIPF